MAASLRNRAITAGDLAGIRRMDPTRLDAAGFWKLAGIHLDHALPGQAEARNRAEVAWGAALVAMATLGGLQRHGERLGRALASAGYSELRLSRILRADHERLLDEVPQLARFLAAKQQPADLVDAVILLTGPESMRDARRRSLARDYFAHTDTP